jgi:hypothetical protein
MLRESQDRDFDNGKIKVVSADAHELRLRWISNIVIIIVILMRT